MRKLARVGGRALGWDVTLQQRFTLPTTDRFRLVRQAVGGVVDRRPVAGWHLEAVFFQRDFLSLQIIRLLSVFRAVLPFIAGTLRPAHSALQHCPRGV